MLMTAIFCLQCFDTVGWVAKGILHVNIWVVGCWCGYLSGARCRFAYGSSDATVTHCLLLQENPDWFWYRLTRVIWDKVQRAIKWMYVLWQLFLYFSIYTVHIKQVYFAHIFVCVIMYRYQIHCLISPALLVDISLYHFGRSLEQQC